MAHIARGALSKYSDQDRATVYTTLTLTGGNVKRTARDTGVPEQTVRDWKHKWDSGEVPAPVQKLAVTQAAEYIIAASSVRDLALAKLAELIPQADVKHIGALSTTVGIMADKIDRANGLVNRTEHTVVHALPPAAVAAEYMNALLGEAERAAKDRALIIDVEVIEQPQGLLPPAS